MRKPADEELRATNVEILNTCPKCNGSMRATMLIGLGVLKPKEQVCVTSGCDFRKDISRG